MQNPLPQWLLAAERPDPSLGPQAEVFDRFAGSWELSCILTPIDGSRTESAGEWHFGWILGGRMMQDTIYFYPEGDRPRDPARLKGGTTLRMPEAKSGLWLVSYFAPLRGEAIHLRGGAQGERIVLRGPDVDGSQLRWSFNDIADSSFLWLGEISADGGATWRVEQEMHLRRMPGVPRHER